LGVNGTDARVKIGQGFFANSLPQLFHEIKVKGQVLDTD
jgi:hypothetical protein